MQEQLRQRYINFLDTTGIKQIYISKNVNIKAPILSQFRHGILELNKSSYKELDEFLIVKGF
jgi:hypothetical protein